MVELIDFDRTQYQCWWSRYSVLLQLPHTLDLASIRATEERVSNTVAALDQSSHPIRLIKDKTTRTYMPNLLQGRRLSRKPITFNYSHESCTSNYKQTHQRSKPLRRFSVEALHSSPYSTMPDCHK